MALGYFEEEEEKEQVDYIGFNDADDEDDEEIYDDSVFEKYSEEEIRDKWGDMSFDDLLGELERIVTLSKKYLFFSKTKRVVNGQEMTNLIELILEKLPGEMQNARDIISSRDSIINSAQQEANAIKTRADQYNASTIETANRNAASIVDGAKKKAEDMVSVHAITQQARAKAEEIIESANNAAYAHKAETKKVCDEHIATTMRWAQEAMQGSNEYANSLLSSVRGVMMKNVSEVDDIARRYAADYAKRLEEIRRGPDFRGASRNARPAQAQQQPPTTALTQSQKILRTELKNKSRCARSGVRNKLSKIQYFGTLFCRNAPKGISLFGAFFRVPRVRRSSALASPKGIFVYKCVCQPKVAR